MEGFQIPIHRSLTQVIMIAGAPREMTILNGTITAALALGLHSLWAIPLSLAVQSVAAHLAKEDPYFFETFRRQIRQRNYYHA